MPSEVTINQECLDKFDELKNKKYKYILFALNKDNTEFIVEKHSQGDYEDFTEDLSPYECRWGAFDLEYRLEVPEGEPQKKDRKLLFVSWIPDTAKMKDKLPANTHKDVLRRRLEGIQVDVSATDYSKLTKETVVAEAKRSTK